MLFGENMSKDGLLKFFSFQTPKAIRTNNHERSLNREKSSVTYGKDVYEHYGIAQGAIAKSDIKKGGAGSNSGSGSRSVSN